MDAGAEYVKEYSEELLDDVGDVYVTGVVVELLLDAASEEAVDATTGTAEGVLELVLSEVVEVSTLTATTVAGVAELSKKIVGT